MDMAEEFRAQYDAGYEEVLPREFVENYVIVECMNSTEGCDTLLVKQKATGRKLVAKCYSKNSILFDTAESALQKELRDMKSQVVPHFEGEYKNAGYRCVLREYIEGVPLDEYVKTNRITEDILTDLAIGLANAMKVLHDAKPAVIHRDIKPENIIVKRDGSIALIDFGISRVFKKDGSADTIFCGTKDYAPPEQYGFLQTDIRSDIYSFGIVLSWMITGKAAPIREPLTRMERIAAKCCEFSPDKRYRDDRALLRDLRKTTRQYAGAVRRRIRNISAVSVCLTVVSLIGGICARGRKKQS